MRYPQIVRCFCNGKGNFDVIRLIKTPHGVVDYTLSSNVNARDAEAIANAFKDYKPSEFSCSQLVGLAIHF